MNNTLLLLGAALLLAAPPIAADAGSQGASASVIRSQGCTNYGNQVLVGSTMSCGGGSDCENYGNQVLVGSSYDCVDGDCPNSGIRVSVGSSFCDHGGTYACVDDFCSDGRPPQTMRASLPDVPAAESQSAAVAYADCIPRLDSWGLRLHLSCDSSGQACGINQEPVCWTVRYACFMGLNAVLRVWDNTVPPMPPARPSSCEGQPSRP